MKSVNTLRVGNVRIYYEVVRPEPQALGEEPPVLVYLAGYGLNNTAFKHQRNHFQKLGAASVAPEQRGDGKSTHSQSIEDYALDAFVGDLESIVHAERIGNFTIVGHSSGAMVAQKYAATHQERIDSLVLIAASYDFGKTFARGFLRHFLLGLSPIGGALETSYNRIAVIFTKDREGYYPDFSAEKFRKISDLGFVLETVSNKSPEHLKGTHALGSAVMGWSTEAAAQLINTPTLIIHGGSDSLVPSETAYELQEMIPGASGIAPVIIPHARHGIIFQTPEEVNHAMERFLVGEIYHGRLRPVGKWGLLRKCFLEPAAVRLMRTYFLSPSVTEGRESNLSTA